MTAMAVFGFFIMILIGALLVLGSIAAEIVSKGLTGKATHVYLIPLSIGVFIIYIAIINSPFTMSIVANQ